MMKTLSLFPGYDLHAVVNVASVPQRSPFRYPGGKTWLVPRLRQWLRSIAPSPRVFVEPFAGGGIISLTVACERLSEEVVMVELDPAVAAVWKTILNGGAEYLARRIETFVLTLDSVQAELDTENGATEEVAFRAILKNRVYHGGILAPGSRPMKHGENGKGIASRWYPATLARRIRQIASVSARIKFVEGDGLEAINDYAGLQDAAFFIDPPYTAAGKRAGARLYTHHALDHEELFRRASAVAGDFLMTYDSAEDVVRMAQRHGFQTRQIAMKNTHHAEMTELLIGRDLHWLDS